MIGELPIHHILDQTNGWALDVETRIDWSAGWKRLYGVLVVAGPYDDGLPVIRDHANR